MKTATLILIIISVLVFLLLLPFLNPILGGFFIAYLVKPLNESINKRIKNKVISSSLTTLFSISLILILSYFFLRTVVVSFIQMQSLVDANMVLFGEIVSTISSNIIFETSASNVVDMIYGWINIAPKTLIDFAIMSIIIFYTLLDFDNVKETIEKDFSKRKIKRFEKFLRRADYIIDSFIQGYLLVGVLISFVVFLSFSFLQIGFALELSTISFAMSVLPVISAWMLLLGISGYYFYFGNYFNFIMIFIVSILLFFINHYLQKVFHVKKGINPLLLVMGLIGGTSVLGIYGFIAGPVIFGIMQAVSEEFIFVS